MNKEIPTKEYGDHHWGEMHHESKAVEARDLNEVRVPVHAEVVDEIAPEAQLMNEVSPSTRLTTRSKKGSSGIWKKLGGFVIVFALIVLGFGWYLHHSAVKKNASQAGVEAGADSVSDAAVISAVRKIILTPDETPKVLTVPQDMTALADDPFFVHASPGDKLLVFTEASEIFLYSPKQGKVLAAGPMNPDLSPQATSTASSTPRALP